jgi:hypothetical protein
VTSPEYVDPDDLFEECDCEEGCPSCAPHAFDPSLVAVGLRLMVAAVDEDIDGIGIAFDEIADCPGCERAVLIAILKTVSRYGGPGLAEALRQELLEILDLVADLAGQSGE